MRLNRTYRLKYVSSVVLLLLSCGSVCLAQDIASKVDELLNAHMKNERFNGAVLIAKKGKILVGKGYGMANFEHNAPVTPQTKFRLASNSKQFTAMAIMQLHERGMLNVNDTVSKYLPDYPKGDQFTIHHLLTHTSGIPELLSFPEFRQRITLPATPEQIIAHFKDKPFDFPPGDRYRYSNSGYILLGYLVEKISGKSYDQFLRENIFQPLGMKNSGSDTHRELLSNRASGYAMTDDGLVNADFIDMTNPVGGGSLYSTIEDMYLWDRALYTEKLVKRGTLDKIFTPFKDNYAYGWHVESLFNRKLINHTGGIQGFRALIQRFEDEDVCIIVLSNLESADRQAMTRDLAAIVFGEKYEVPKVRVLAKVDPRFFDAYVGQYKFPTSTVTISKEGDRLIWQGNFRARLFPESPTKFYMRARPITVTFKKNDRGEVTEVVLDQGPGRVTMGERVK